jgi:hypothetical protein
MSQRSVAQISFAQVGSGPTASNQQKVETKVIPQTIHTQQQAAAPATRRGRQQQQAVVSQPPPGQPRAPQQPQVQVEQKPQQPVQVVQLSGQSIEPARTVGAKRGSLPNCDNEYGTPSTKFFGKPMSLRAPKAGDAFHTEQKREKRYDEEEKLGTPRRVMEWIGRALQGQIPAMNGLDAASIISFLRDGTVLCSLMNKLLRHANMPPIGYRKKVNSAFVAMSNLEVFVDACKRYGVPESSLFLPSDLYEARKAQLLTVINCLNALGCVGNARGFQPPYEEPEPPKADWCKEESYD